METSSAMIDDLQLLHGALQFPVEVCCAGCNKPTTWAVSVSRLITYKLVHFTKGVMHWPSRVKERVFQSSGIPSPPRHLLWMFTGHVTLPTGVGDED